MAADIKVKKVAKMGHHEASKDTGRKPSIPCGCGGRMDWSKIPQGMRYVCNTCSLVCQA